ncbi:MAG TPA: glycosyltransferase family 39 protein [Arenibacter sp.]|nr:glycosyltransferase family 39 protein [Arenibacter sp.]
MPQKTTKIFLVFLAAIFVLNLLQSANTELLLDEAYYWFYAQDLAWGYFDHPPMVAWMIHLGSAIFPAELGVRLISCIMYTINIALLWTLIDHPRKERYILLFCVLVLSPTLFHAYGFLTLPDTALLFFTTLFLLLYKRFLTKTSLWNTVLLGILMAAMMYSKYHGLLVILFVLFSNFGLVRNKYAWLSASIALVCYIPHLLWLMDHHFISLQYHLSDRPFSPYNFTDFTLGYFLNLLALFGLIFPLVYFSLVRTRITGKFSTALVYIVYGFILFFFVSSFSRRVQTQWLIVISIPLIIITFNYMVDHPKIRLWILRLGLPNITILLFLRIWLINGSVLPISFETHFNRTWVNILKDEVGDMPVVFENSYGNAATYTFYSGNKAYSLNNAHYRLNQYSIDDSEEDVQHKRILYVSRYLREGDLEFIGAKGKEYKGKYMDDFESFRKLYCMVADNPVSVKDSTALILKVYNPYPVDIALKKLKFGATFLNPYKRVTEIAKITPMPLDTNLQQLNSKDTTLFKVQLPSPTVDGAAYIRFGISENGLPYGYNSKNIKLN